eukprot:g1990.t1
MAVFTETDSSENTVFDSICSRCISIASVVFTAADLAASGDNFKRSVIAFCRIAGFFTGPDRCVATLSSRLESAYKSGRTVFTPEAICQVYGACFLASRSPSIQTMTTKISK